MKIKEALDILNLKEPFTSDELKRAFRDQMVLNHPDNFSSSSEEVKQRQGKIAQRLNEAREILTNYLKNNPYTWSNDKSDELSNIKKQYSDLVNRYNNNGRRYKSLKADSVIYDIGSLVFKFDVRISICSSKQEIEKCFKEFLYQLKLLYLKTLKEYRNSYCIYEDVDEFKYDFNFDCTADEFVKSLEDYGVQYNRYIKERHINAIDTLVEGFKGYAGYDVLKNNIDSLKQDAIDKLENSLISFSQILNSLCVSINDMFYTYFDNVKRYDELVSKYDKLGIIDDSIDYKLQELKSHITDFKKFPDMYKKLLIEINEKVCLSDLNKTYQDLLRKYTAELSSLDFCDNVDKINFLSGLLERTNSILSKILEFKSLDIDPNGLRLITFKDTDSDLKIIEEYEDQIKKYSSSSSNLFRILSSIDDGEVFEIPQSEAPIFK